MRGVFVHEQLGLAAGLINKRRWSEAAAAQCIFHGERGQAFEVAGDRSHNQ